MSDTTESIPNPVRRSMLTIRLPTSEYILVRDAASREGKSIQAFCRDELLAEARRVLGGKEEVSSGSVS